MGLLLLFLLVLLLYYCDVWTYWGLEGLEWRRWLDFWFLLHLGLNVRQWRWCLFLYYRRWLIDERVTLAFFLRLIKERYCLLRWLLHHERFVHLIMIEWTSGHVLWLKVRGLLFLLEVIVQHEGLFLFFPQSSLLLSSFKFFILSFLFFSSTLLLFLFLLLLLQEHLLSGFTT